jgi:hypothetical protein
MQYNITDFDHSQGTFVVFYSDGAYLNFMAPRKDGAYSSGTDLENYIQWRHPSVVRSHRFDIEPFMVEEQPDTDLPSEIVEKTAIYKASIVPT